MKISKIREYLHTEDIVFTFSGLISQSLIEFIIETKSNQFDLEGLDEKYKKKLFLICIEQLHNIMSYTKEKNIINENQYSSPGIVIIGFDKIKEKYYVSSSNEIQKEDEEKISKKIDDINIIEKNDLRKLLREKLRNSENSHDRGAGVGFIEMAKRSSEQLEYEFENIDGKKYFHILVYI